MFGCGSKPTSDICSFFLRLDVHSRPLAPRNAAFGQLKESWMLEEKDHGLESENRLFGELLVVFVGLRPCFSRFSKGVYFSRFLKANPRIKFIYDLQR